MTSQTPRTARITMMDHMARRQHSEKELREKLSPKFSSDEIEEALNFAKSKKWLPESDSANIDLAQTTADSLHKRGKGILYINQYLEQKGLPPVAADDAFEEEKALQLIKTKLKTSDGDSAQLGRFLISRGFTMDVVRNVLKGFPNEEF